MATRRVITIAAAGILTLMVFGGTAVAVAGSDDASTPLPRFDASSVTVTETPSSSAARAATPAPAVDRAQAEQIALAHVGGGSVTRVEQEIEHGRPEWKVRVTNGGVERDVRIDSGTGAVTRVDTDDRTRNTTGTGTDDRTRSTTGTDDNGRGTDDRVGTDDRGRGTDDLAGTDDNGGHRGRGSDDRGGDDRGRGSDG